MNLRISVRAVMYAVLVGVFSGNAFAAECGQSTRVTLDALRCEDAGRSTWYQINVNEMCGTYSGDEQSVLELEETRPGVSNVRKSIFESQIESTLGGQSEVELFRQRAGEKGVIEAFAISSGDQRKIDQVRLNIVPNEGEACAKTVDVSGVWGKY